MNMAIDTWFTGTVDGNAANKPDGANHLHIIKRNTAPANDITVSFDRTKIVSRRVLRSVLLQILTVVEGGNELTA